MKALRTNASGLPRPAALLGALVVLVAGALDPVLDPAPEPEVVVADDVEVRVAMLMVVLRLIGMPVSVPTLAGAPVPTIPVPMTAVVVAL